MAQCFPCTTCGCDYGGLTQSDLDRFTDKIENVLNDVNGRRFFRHFLITSKLKDGKRCLDVWEETERVINSPAAQSDDPKIFDEFLCEVDNLIENAERIDDLDYLLIEKMTNSRDTEDRMEIISILKLLKSEITKAMRNEYLAFRKHYVKKD